MLPITRDAPKFRLAKINSPLRFQFHVMWPRPTWKNWKAIYFISIIYLCCHLFICSTTTQSIILKLKIQVLWQFCRVPQIQFPKLGNTGLYECLSEGNGMSLGKFRFSHFIPTLYMYIKAVFISYALLCLHR